MRMMSCWSVLAAVAVMAGGAIAQEPAAEEQAAVVVRETGFQEEAIKAGIVKVIPSIEFTGPAMGDGRRRVFGTVAKARMPLVELLGAPDDLMQVSAMSPLNTPLGAAAVETSPFAVAVLEVGVPDWAERKAWLRAALKKVQETGEDYQVSEERGKLKVSFAAWQKLGAFRVTVESAAGAAVRASQKSGIPGTGEPESPRSEAGAVKLTEGAPAKIEEKPDGSSLVDGRFIVKGKGTEGEPYELVWEHLLSAEEEYVPKEGRKDMPGRIMMLEGKWVQMTGYIAFPLMSDQPDECLSMMNQWDGCCIGIPPTPYDAIEVRLLDPVKGDMRLTTYGVVKGKFKIAPHLVGGWLVGLYGMEQATMKPEQYGGFAP